VIFRSPQFSVIVTWAVASTIPFFVHPAPAFANSAPDLSAFVIRAPRIAAPVAVDATLDDPAWQTAAHTRLTWNVDFRRPADDATDAYLLADDSYLYVTFVARQSSQVLATQLTAGKAVGSDDWVAVLLWPSGVNGFSYTFKCNALGICDQTSTENDDFAPIWIAAGRKTSGGFTVSMRIPLDILRGDGRDRWRIQFARAVNSTGDETPVWAYANGMDDEGQANFAGYLDGMRGLGAAARPQARLAIYGLGAIAPHSAGGDTSRVGADFAIPISRTASIVGTAHPDYSNVELDQQTIVPSEFRREFQEVRPFFTQGASFYNKFSGINDNGNIMLYTPGVPTPADGLAVEGTSANLGFAAFDAGSKERNDSAQTASWTSDDKWFSAALQRVTVDQPGITDRATAGTFRIDNQRNAFAYADIGSDAGSDVLDASQASWSEFGAARYGPTSFLGVVLRKIGKYYDPVDGFVAHPDIAGWAANGEQDLLPPRPNPIVFAAMFASIDRYHDASGVLDQADQNLTFALQTRTQFSVSAFTGSNFLLSTTGPGGEPCTLTHPCRGAFFNQNGASVGYRDQTSTPTDVSYSTGDFGDGYLRSWQRSSAVRVGTRGVFSVEADDTSLLLNDGVTVKQWLERAGYAYQLGGQASVGVGVRRVVGYEPPVFSELSYVDETNVSIALHDRVGRDDLYLVYGDANAQKTPPVIILKWVRYFGAEKGT
jgi:hypothetical protein